MRILMENKSKMISSLAYEAPGCWNSIWLNENIINPITFDDSEKLEAEHHTDGNWGSEISWWC